MIALRQLPLLLVLLSTVPFATSCSGGGGSVVSGGGGSGGSADNSLLVGPSFTTVPNAIVGRPYSFSGFQLSGGLPPYSWSFLPNVYAPPPGLSVDPLTGVVGGVPASSFSGSLCVQALDSGVPPQEFGNCPAFEVYNQVKVATSVLPTIVANARVNLEVGASGGIGNYAWAQIGGALPPGVSFSPSTATISGQTSAIGAFELTLQVSDAGPPSQTSDPTTLQFIVAASPGRNNSLAAATQLSNGIYEASLSPVADPPTGVANADSDYYRITANPGSFVIAEITAVRLNPPSPFDPVLEFVDSNNNTLSYCTFNADSTPFIPATFDRLCVNDDLAPGLTGSIDSKLALLVPSNNSGPLTFYAHVLDFRGDARPDFVYTITVSGAN